MNSPDKIQRAVIPPLIERHVADAAFCWRRRDLFSHSPLFVWPVLLHFDDVLDAHLDGARTAEEAGWQQAVQALEEWKGAGELFVCAVLGIERGQGLEPVWKMLHDKPETYLRALISAALWQKRVGTLVEQWICSDDELQQVAAWRMLARGNGFIQPDDVPLARLQAALVHPSAHIRAAACRASFRCRQSERVLACLDDEPVAAEAAIALLRSGDLRGLPRLRAAVLAHAATLGPVRHDPFGLTLRRFDRWLRYLAVATPPGDKNIKELLDALPPRQALLFILRHGDPVWLPRVRQYMSDPGCACHAGWVWSSLTGIPIEDSELELAIEDRDQDALDENEWLTDDIDLGLPMPDAKAVAEAEPPFPAGQRILLGRPLHELDLCALLREVPQALRWLAAAHLERRKDDPILIDICAPARRQAAG